MRRQQGARNRSQAMEEMAKPIYEWSGWRKKGTQTISLISLTNLVNKISFKDCYHKVLSLSREKWNGSHPWRFWRVDGRNHNWCVWWDDFHRIPDAFARSQRAASAFKSRSGWPVVEIKEEVEGFSARRLATIIIIPRRVSQNE
jgi:hypothetical protein